VIAVHAVNVVAGQTIYSADMIEERMKIVLRFLCIQRIACCKRDTEQYWIMCNLIKTWMSQI